MALEWGWEVSYSPMRIYPKRIATQILRVSGMSPTKLFLKDDNDRDRSKIDGDLTVAPIPHTRAGLPLL